MAAAPADRAKSIIAALRAKTTKNGCTEAEAMAAAEAAARIMREHGLTEDEVVMSEARSRERTSTSTWRSALAAAIAQVTNTALILEDGAFLFIGLAPAPEIAAYLRDVCVRAVETELKTFKAGTFYRRRRAVRTKRAAAADFCEGMTWRLRSRIRDLFAGTKDPEARAAAQRALVIRFPKTQSMRGRARDVQYFDAVHAGAMAGDRVTLGHGVAGSAGGEQLRLEHIDGQR